MLTARITPDESFCSDPEHCLAFYRDLLDRTHSSPGITGAALINTLPLSGRVAKRSFDLENFSTSSPTQTQPLFWLDIVSSDYFRVMGIPLVSGRWFNESDSAGGPPVVVVSATTAKRFWTDGDAVGKHVRFVGEKDWRTVVGVVADVRAYDLQHNEPDFMKGTAYVPYTAAATLEDGRVPAEMTIAVRTASDSPDAASLLHNILASSAPNIPVSEVRTMRAVLSEATSSPAATTLLFGTFAGAALVLGIVGVYGVLSYLVSRRRREMGVRMALGAQRSDVLWLVIKEGAKFSATGIALGLAGAFSLGRLLSSQLYGISPVDPVTYITVAIVVALVSLAACLIPARRAMAIDPLIAIRYD